MKRWFITVDWCNQGKRGILCRKDGGTWSKETQHTQDEMLDFIGLFGLILNPESIELSEAELKEYHRFIPLSEFSGEYGIALKGK